MRNLARAAFAILIFSALHLLAQTKPISDLDAGHMAAEPQLFWGGDPFNKTPGYHLSEAGVDEEDPSKYQLTGIVYDKAQPMAVVNGKVVSVNAFVGSRRVVEIGRNYVVLEQEDSRVELQLPPIKESRAEIKPMENHEGKK